MKVGLIGQESGGQIYLAQRFWQNTFIKDIGKRIEKTKFLDANKIDNKIISSLENLECLIIDNYKNNIDPNTFYSLLNHSKQLENYILINDDYSNIIN